MRYKNLIFISSGYKGGATKFIEQHISFQKKNNIYLIDENPQNTYKYFKYLNYINTIKLPIHSKKIFSYKKLKLFFYYHNFDRAVIFLSNFSIFIYFFFLFRKLQKKNKIKIVLTIHSGIFQKNIKSIIACLLFSIIYKKLDLLFFGSYSAKNWWKKYFPWMNIKNNNVIYNGVDIPKNVIKKKSSSLRISFIGRLESENNPFLFIKVAEFFFKKYSNNKYVFNIFGEGSLKTEIQKILRPNTIYFGWKSREFIYKNSDLILITSPVNNFPYIALEAKSFGVPVISCSQGDVSKIINNNYDGFILKNESILGFVDKIFLIQKKYSFFSANSLKNRYNFATKDSCKKFWDLINQ